MPFMQPPRVVILRGVDSYSADELSLFLKYLDSPNEDAILVLVADKVDWRLKFFKALKDKGMVVSFDPPRGKGLVTWVQDAMKRRGPDMTRPAAEALIEQVGTDPAELDREVEKISLYAMGQSRVDVDAVREAARLGHTANVFKLGDAVGRQNVDEAMAAIDDLLATDHHLPVLIMLIRHFRILLKAKIFMDAKRPKNEAPKALGVPPFTIGNYMDQARELSLEEIKKGLVRLQQANLTLVTTQTPERLVMDSLILELSQLKMRRRTGP
jgi:DNA polymerase-3 subunit delta